MDGNTVISFFVAGGFMSFLPIQKMASSLNFDTITKDGIYRIDSEITGENKPPIKGTSFGSILIVTSGVTTICSQVYISVSDAKIYTRRRTSASWTEWFIN